MAFSFSGKFNNMSEKKVEWPKEAVLKLLEEWEKCEYLYNTKMKLYSNKHARYAALNNIAEQLKVFIPTITPEEVKVKMGYLRGQYTRELGKIESVSKSGCGTEDLYEPSAYWFNGMAFLHNHVKTRKYKSNCETDVGLVFASNFDGEEAQATTFDFALDNQSTTSSTLMSPPPAKKNRYQETEANQNLNVMLERASTAIEAVASSCAEGRKLQFRKDIEIFGQHVMAEMEKLDEELCDEAKHIISNTLYNLKCKQRKN